jgi:hypothetical protein
MARSRAERAYVISAAQVNYTRNSDGVTFAPGWPDQAFAWQTNLTRRLMVLCM